MWRIKQIFDGEYGCEERPDEEKARCVVTLENERGERRELSVYDDWLKEKHLEEGSEWTAELFDICNEEGQPIGGMVEACILAIALSIVLPRPSCSGLCQPGLGYPLALITVCLAIRHLSLADRAILNNHKPHPTHT